MYKKPCQLKEFIVDFQELGWADWVLAPANFTMNFCAGNCATNPIPAHMNATNHAIFQNLYHSMGGEIPQPCCTAIEFADLTMLTIVDKSLTREKAQSLNNYIEINEKPFDQSENETPVLLTFKNMTAISCGCH